MISNDKEINVVIELLNSNGIPYKLNQTTLVFYLFGSNTKIKIKKSNYGFYSFIKYYSFNDSYLMEYNLCFNTFEHLIYDTLLDLIIQHKKFVKEQCDKVGI